MPFETIRWNEEGLVILDQRELPVKEKYLILTTLASVADAIRTLAVRGAPAIGVAAAYGVVVAARETNSRTAVAEAINLLGSTRPTAVNLFAALKRMESCLDAAFDSKDPVGLLLECAHEIHEEDIRICRELSMNGADLLRDGDTVLTHCNAGALATSGFGTALGVIYAAREQGKRISVYADETRPLLQGARLTAWELMRNGVPVTVICDSMAAVVMKQGLIDCVIVGADRVAANGDTANKIGTYSVSVNAHMHDIPFYVAAPLTSFDFSMESGNEIPIEERDPSEIHSQWGIRTAPDVDFYNPAFDVTPAEHITAIITEKGVARQPLSENLKKWKTEPS